MDLIRPILSGQFIHTLWDSADIQINPAQKMGLGIEEVDVYIT